MKKLFNLLAVVTLLVFTSCSKSTESCYQFATVKTVNKVPAGSGYPYDYPTEYTINCGITENEAQFIANELTQLESEQVTNGITYVITINCTYTKVGR